MSKKGRLVLTEQDKFRCCHALEFYYLVLLSNTLSVFESLSLSLRMSALIFFCTILPYICVVLISVWPNNSIAVSIGTSFNNKTVVAKVCLAVWVVSFFFDSAQISDLFQVGIVALITIHR